MHSLFLLLNCDTLVIKCNDPKIKKENDIILLYALSTYLIFILVVPCDMSHMSFIHVVHGIRS
jgi:hypothetical protein